ncbi:hypothetical protein HRG_004882 [Hirsutella rhossiliensis]|uniref:Uncharacterized protein n=1 Tax=Hirsutella rhossiliensis TaxID=111463 RepID=A0A9P8N222_9HYPO|nr:uncharacterized protein HRG_04882 [Hirsutella rhossiliensis]KAH0964454.1 hypothetical protein HRG_04882 [Hirsutella rhossiliensis]
MGTAPPFMYSAERRDSRFPDVPFDPKVVTRASWEPKTRKAQPRGPLISLNRHPDSHSVVPHLSKQPLPLGPRAKKWIKRLRRLQLGLRVLQLNGALGTLTLMILIVNIEAVTAWTLRIAPAISIIHTLYATYHLSRGAASRTPASSAAYHVFSFVADLGIVGIYAFGAFSVHQKAGSWATRLTNQHLMHGFVPAAYYLLIGTGALHLVSLAISLWLGLMFRTISLMPPDMNPLEDHLTARPSRKRNKSSITTTSCPWIRSESTHSLCRPANGYAFPSRLPVWIVHSQVRIAKFTETWLPTDSLISRTNHRTRNTMVETDMGQVRVSQLYSALPQEYNLDDSSETEENGEWEPSTELSLGKLHPNPLRSHPALRPRGVPTTGKAYLTDSQSAMELPGRIPLSDMSGNQKQPSLSQDIADQLHGRPGSWQLHRTSSIQAEDNFCLKSPGELVCATPPLMIGGNRKISSGNDYGFEYSSMAYGRRNVSGKQVEEGRAGTRVPLRSCAI